MSMRTAAISLVTLRRTVVYLIVAYALWFLYLNRIGIPIPHITVENDFSCSCASLSGDDVPLNISNLAARDVHVFREDGLLEVDPTGRHPILDLIERAEQRWKARLQGQSRTFEQAIREYRRRYGRAPPKGFDAWWEYVQENHVQLPDEYDLIYHNLEPFWGIEPSKLIQLRDEAEAKIFNDRGGYVLFKNETVGLSTRHDFEMWRVYDQLELLKPIADFLPDFRALVNIHDGPGKIISHEHRSALIEAASTGIYMDGTSPDDIHSPGWAAVCPPSSPLRRGETESQPSSTSINKTFIHDHSATMDPCFHPSHTRLNGFLSTRGTGSLTQPSLAPIFSICTTALHSDILAVALDGFVDDLEDDIPWDEKVDERLLWRGSNTGIHFSQGLPWQESQRIRLVNMTNTREGEVDALIPRRDNESIGYPVKARSGSLNSAMMDLSFTYEAVQCGGDGTCDILGEQFEFRKWQSWEEARTYKYVMDIDGNGWSSRFKRLITSNSLIFKATIHPEWFTDRIMPWVHYIPVQNDLSDLYDNFLFFHGDLNGNNGHDDLAHQIAQRGREWSKSFWRQEDLRAYMFRLVLEYARVSSLDRDAMTLAI